MSHPASRSWRIAGASLILFGALLPLLATPKDIAGLVLAAAAAVALRIGLELAFNGRSKELLAATRLSKPAAVLALGAAAATGLFHLLVMHRHVFLASADVIIVAVFLLGLDAIARLALARRGGKQD